MAHQQEVLASSHERIDMEREKAYLAYSVTKNAPDEQGMQLTEPLEIIVNFKGAEILVRKVYDHRLINHFIDVGERALSHVLVTDIKAVIDEIGELKFPEFPNTPEHSTKS